jgi:ribonuclease BN (tRNA processing enzyme)
MIRFAAICILALFSVLLRAEAQSCPDNGIAVQILGSGGPRGGPDRASASYLLWIDGRSRILVDAGGGAFLRFGQAGGRLADLSLIAISHLHPDHVSDLPALLWLSETARQELLPIAGPSGNEVMPSFPTFLRRLFDEETGAFPLLSGTLGGASGRGVRLEVETIDITKSEPSPVHKQQDFEVTAVGIPHANIPALAYRVRARDKTIVLSTDQNGTDPRFVEFARGADVLVMHLAIGAGGSSPFHASPSVVGRIARDAGAGRLVVGHLGQFDLDAAVAELKQYYKGPLTVGADLQCTSAS